VQQGVLDNLRCDYQGETYAVLEDIENEYLYCAMPSPGRNLTVARMHKLIQGYMEQTIDPDKVRSQKPPEKNEGPLYRAVADTLMADALQPDYDVVLHFYSDTDDKWEDSEFELQKYAEMAEDAKHVKVYKIDGLRNERPKDFPDLGFFPCTWMFPMYDKYQPRQFNQSAGFTAQRLLWWTHYTSSFELEPHMLPGKLRALTGSPIGINGARPEGSTPKSILSMIAQAKMQLASAKENSQVQRVFQFHDNFDHSMVEYAPLEPEPNLPSSVKGIADTAGDSSGVKAGGHYDKKQTKDEKKEEL